MFNGRGPLLWLIQTAPVVRDLREAVRVSPKTSVKPHVSVGGADCVVISLETPDTEQQKWHYDIFLDRTKKYVIRRATSTASDVPVHGLKDPIKITTNTEALEFQEPKPGIFVPRFVRIERSDSDFISIYRIENVVVNEPLPADAGKFGFPEWCVVANFLSGKTEIMGKNNTVVASFSKPGERSRWLADNASGISGSGTERQAWTRIAVLVVINVLALCAVIAFGIRRRLKPKRSRSEAG
jgi:hypothetical protein